LEVALSVYALGAVLVSVCGFAAVGLCFVVRFNIVCGAVLHGLWCAFTWFGVFSWHVWPEQSTYK